MHLSSSVALAFPAAARRSTAAGVQLRLEATTDWPGCYRPPTAQVAHQLRSVPVSHDAHADAPQLELHYFSTIDEKATLHSKF
jgi:hypothetical protein